MMTEQGGPELRQILRQSILAQRDQQERANKEASDRFHLRGKESSISSHLLISCKHKLATFSVNLFPPSPAIADVLPGRCVLRSTRAVQMSVFVIRAFVKMRETLLGTRELAKKLAALERQLTGRLDSHEAAIVHVLQELMLILNPPPLPPPPPKPQIGFKP